MSSNFICCHANYLGSTHIVTNASGVKVEEIRCNPLGATFSDTGQVSVTHKYTSREFDAETGLYYYGARYYDPVLGRFVQADTLATLALRSLNRYGYVQLLRSRWI